MKNVLIVDDEARYSDALKSEIEAAGYSVDVAHDGVEAVLKALDKRYDVALLDMVMPNLDGINAVRILKKVRAEMPIIALSGSMEHDRLSETIKAGALMFVHKPFSTHWLISQIKWVVGDK
ncbi:MAG: response regulator [Thermodesulfobacteriota bacterium]